MSDYKLVPVEPTAEMVEAAQDAYMPFGDMDIALRMALLTAPDHTPDTSKKVSRPQIREVFLRNGAKIEPDRDDLQDYVYESVFDLLELAAPAVQGEPLGYVVPRMAVRLGKGELCGISVLDQPEDGHTLPVYLAPQPTAQHPVAWQRKDRPERVITKLSRRSVAEVENGVEFIPLYDAPQPAEQQREPCHECGGNGAGGEHEDDCSQQVAPDVSALVEALEAIGRMSYPDHNLFNAVLVARAALAALAAHRKGGE